MSSFDKLLDRFLSLDKNLRFDEVKKILEKYGYVMTNPRGGSSHFIFKKKGQSSITIPKHNPIKKVYVIMVKEVIERNDENNE